jgi:hypothetical protein
MKILGNNQIYIFPQCCVGTYFVYNETFLGNLICVQRILMNVVSMLLSIFVVLMQYSVFWIISFPV